MRDIPIIFSAPMIRALLDDRKTMTRRTKYSPRGPLLRWHKVQAGDRLWVKETWMQPFAMANRQATDKSAGFIYRADGPEYCSPATRDHQIGGGGKWKSSLFCARIASRLTLIVTATKIERLQEISEADATAEGVAPRGPEHPFGLGRKEFSELWTSLHGPDAWGANPEVVALTFTVHKQNIDALNPSTSELDRSRPGESPASKLGCP